MIKQESIDKIRDLSIYDVISSFIGDGELKKTGSTYRGKSPFNDEKTPSFYVVPGKNIWKDFSSGKGGDAIKFVMLHQNVEFIRAVELIADKMNERLEYDRPATDEEKQNLSDREELHMIMEAAARKYSEQLFKVIPEAYKSESFDLNEPMEHPATKELINKRKFTADTLIQWEIGYAPNEWKFLTTIVNEKGLTEQAKRLSLVREKDSNLYDAFRHRVIYPIRDHRGRLVAFGGRALPDPGNDRETAKYINSNESPIYKKSEVLFGLHHSIPTIRKKGFAYLMEGYTDVISFHQANETNAVGTCGTALTKEQAKLLKKYCQKVVLVGDPDDAGQRAVLTNIDIMVAEGFEVHVLPCPMFVSWEETTDEGKQVRRELCFVQSDKSKGETKIRFAYNNALETKVLHSKSITSVEKVDPDELVRLFSHVTEPSNA